MTSLVELKSYKGSLRQSESFCSRHSGIDVQLPDAPKFSMAA